MTPNKLHKMLSFGFTEKGSGKASQHAIGVYGNGFKSGSMRLGRDALIFTKNGGCQTVGMLSQTYLENIKAQAVIVPIVPFNQQTKSLVTTEDSEASLAAILTNSIITSLEQIHVHFDSIPAKKGTKILIWNIRRAKDGNPEIDFDTDTADFRLPSIQIEELRKGLRSSGTLRAEQNIPDMHYSLRAYLSILYLKPRTQVILRGKKNLPKLVAKRLKHVEHDVYKPHFSKEKVKVTFGLTPKNKDHYGIMMYHKNRLIKAYEKVGCQLKASGQRVGVGVIGVIECNFLRPAHNKQDFEYTKEYRLTLGALGLKLNDYWREVTEKKAREREFQALDRDNSEDDPDDVEAPVWLQCEECLKWRSVPADHYDVVPESWNCSQNPNPRYRSCSSPEEAEDSEELLTPSYQKNHKKHEQPKSRKRERSLEVCVPQDPAAKHQILLRSSSEPSQRVGSEDQCQAEDDSADQTTSADDPGDNQTDTHANEDAGEQNAASAEATHTRRESTGRDTVIKDMIQGQEETETSDRRREDEEGNKKKDRSAEPTERERERPTLSLKRKPGSLFYCVKKKPCLWEVRKPDSENMAEEKNPGKQKDATETPSSEKTKQDGSSRAEKQADKAQRVVTNLTWTHSLPSTQTVMVSPLSRTEGPRSRPPPPQGSDWDVNVQRLAGLEKEAQRLRRLLGLEIKKTTQGTMTTADGGPATADSREVGCQTDDAESSTSSSSPDRASGLEEVLAQGQGAVCGPKEQPEQDRPSKDKMESQSRVRASDNEAFEDIRSPQESLLGIRNNVVVLLTALLPHLDLGGISMETTDVDNVLQQIIEVNSLKL
ncbi:MORC family CW-type zinc finger protein 3 isoform X3 [Acanthopagrus latus]|nr:MORC family CW-type zinc finger protein 3 isoform X3 [Acanthopagrus latus]